MRYVPLLWLWLPCLAVAQAQSDGLTLLYQADTLVADSLGAAFGPEAQEADVFFVGESHGFYENQTVQFEMLKYLHKYQGVREVVLEKTVLDEWYFNRFVLEGDSAALKKSSVGQWVGTDKEELLFIDFLRKLRAYNESLPQQEQIVVRCLDLDTDLIFDFRKKKLTKILAEISRKPYEKVKKRVDEVFKDVQAGKPDELPAKELKGLLKYLRTDRLPDVERSFIDRCLECFRVSWGFEGRGNMLSTIMQLKKREYYEDREEFMLWNFLQRSRSTTGKTLCITGKAHAKLNHETGFSSFSNRLKGLGVNLHITHMCYLDRYTVNPFSEKPPKRKKGFIGNGDIFGGEALQEQAEALVSGKYSFLHSSFAYREQEIRLLLILKKPYGIY